MSRSLGMPLHHAADSKVTKYAVALLDRGARIDAPNLKGHTRSNSRF
jgi:hypothetical protein